MVRPAIPIGRRLMYQHCCSHNFVPVNLLAQLWKPNTKLFPGNLYLCMYEMGCRAKCLAKEPGLLISLMMGKDIAMRFYMMEVCAVQQSSWNKTFWRINQLVLRHVDSKGFDLRLLMSDIIFACAKASHVERTVLPGVTNSQRQPRPGYLRLNSPHSSCFQWINELPYTLTD